MKVTDLRRKLMAALVAGGTLAPSAMYAADLNTNLVTNGDFETVDLGTTTDYDAPLILNWSGAQGWAYSHNPLVTEVPDYAEGPDPPSAGNWYFSSNLSNPDINAPGMFYQDIDVSQGDTGSVIANGLGGLNMSAYISSYLDDTDIGHVHAQFRTGSGAVLGFKLMSDSDPGSSNVWNLNTATGPVPVGTATVRLSIYGTRTSGGPGPDGYIDNVAFSVVEVPLSALKLTVDRDDGTVTMSNTTGSAVNLSGYSITSGFEGLTPASWLSIADNYDSGNPGLNQFDSAHAWSELTDPSTHGDLSEADLQSGAGASFANARTVNLGNANTWIRSHTEDLVFQYIANGQVVDGVVTYTGNGNNPFELGDINTSGQINSTDWNTFRMNQHADLSALSLAEAYRAGDLNGDKLNNHADFVLFKAAYEAANGSGSFIAMINRVPEPSSALLVLASGLLALPVVSRSRNRK